MLSQLNPRSFTYHGKFPLPSHEDVLKAYDYLFPEIEAKEKKFIKINIAGRHNFSCEINIDSFYLGIRYEKDISDVINIVDASHNIGCSNYW